MRNHTNVISVARASHAWKTSKFIKGRTQASVDTCLEKIMEITFTTMRMEEGLEIRA